jgi:TatD DNase family protein
MDSEVKIRPSWVDFHCHLDLYPDHADLIEECDREKVATLAVTTTPKAWQRNHQLASGSQMVRAGLGLHPQLVAERASEIALFEKLLENTRYVGEVGLDAGPRHYRSFEEQERVFARILCACGEQGSKVLTIHSIKAASKVLDQLDQHLPPDRAKCILHWFTGTNAEAKRAIEYGCYFSINAEMLRNPKHRPLVAKLPLDRLLTETDGPFINKDGRPLRPKDVQAAVVELASVHNIPAAEMAKAILVNLRNMLV